MNETYETDGDAVWLTKEELVACEAAIALSVMLSIQYNVEVDQATSSVLAKVQSTLAILRADRTDEKGKNREVSRMGST